MTHAPITKEERDALRARIGDRVKNILITRKDVIATGKAYGVIDCPVCKTGKVSFTVAEYNGHVHAQCSTRLCMSWIE